MPRSSRPPAGPPTSLTRGRGAGTPANPGMKSCGILCLLLINNSPRLALQEDSRSAILDEMPLPQTSKKWLAASGLGLAVFLDAMALHASGLLTIAELKSLDHRFTQDAEPA